jgi:hypothetical protein
MRTSKAEMRPIINSTNSKVKYNDEIERELKELD